MICKQCEKEYNEQELNIPMPIPDLMCSECGSFLTIDEVNYLKSKTQSSQQA